jgi:hypothetical protein
MNTTAEYLVSHGVAGALVRCRGEEGLRRGDRVVLRTARGLELGTVLREATSRLTEMLHDSAAGEISRRATDDDHAQAERNRERSAQIFEESRRLVQELNLPIEVLDVEILLDEQQAILHTLGGNADALRQALARRHDLAIFLHDLAVQPIEEGEVGCGKPGCGGGHGGCTSCSSGGCGTGCGTPELASQVAEHFANLRQRMESHFQRTPLL